MRAAFALAPAIPEPAVPPLARTTAHLEYLLASRRRHAVRSNLAQIARAAHPDLAHPRRLDRAVRSVFTSYHRFVIEYLGQRSLDLRALYSRFRFSGMELFYGALAFRRGAVVSAPHIGNWELAGLALARLGFSIHVVTGVQFHARVSRHARRLKERERILVSTPADGFHPLLRTLRRGGVVVLLTDGDVFVRSLEAPFFGARVPFPVGPALLARRARAPLLHAHAERSGGRHRVSFDGVEHPDPRAPLREDVERLTRTVALAQERTIREHAHEWCIFRPVFAGGHAA